MDTASPLPLMVSPEPSTSSSVANPVTPSKYPGIYKEMDLLRKERNDAQEELKLCRSLFNAARLSVDTVRGDNKQCMYYTGLAWDVFETTFGILSEEINSKGILKTPLIDQYFLTLVKLKHNPKFQYLANQAGISHPSTMTDYFWRWIDLISCKLSFMVQWPDRDRIRQTVPLHFRDKYPKLTGIIDCFEIFVETPGPVKAHAQLYSNYKKHTTVKYLIACNPLGAVSFLSRGYGGRISDVNIVRQSGILTLQNHFPGDQILADRGFTMVDEFAATAGVDLVIPSFIKGQRQFSAEDVQESRKKASVRIHIERIIGLIKNRFEMLQGVIPLRLAKSIKNELEEDYFTNLDKIVLSCAILVNLGQSIVFNVNSQDA